MTEGQRTVVRRVLIGLVVLACIGGLVLAASRTQTGEPDVEESGDPAVVELFFPAPDSEVLRQAQIGIDLTPLYTGRLVVNGVPIPEDQLQRRPELNQVFFSPGEGKAVEELPAGENCVDAVVWQVESSEAAGSRTVSWCFEVT